MCSGVCTLTVAAGSRQARADVSNWFSVCAGAAAMKFVIEHARSCKNYSAIVVYFSINRLCSVINCCTTLSRQQIVTVRSTVILLFWQRDAGVG